ncbi:MAG TPA: dihydroorotate dehydrogenase-like protein [Spirochaetota bacterium]|nr:dihydroorotate dehydrogenase-like protein [Spirochaetota bacterium]HPI90621.1 dihydroorotate dehydrogenase-like protein [Spirochaetota bacterium]HPR46863.1 dihydroorotate dehydrogenase-like protein [Spirochaetota bacterium]
MSRCKTTYLGLELRNPVVVASCGFTANVKDIVALEKNGAGAVVLKSLFEEEILMETGSMAPSSSSSSYGNEAEAYLGYYIEQNQINDYTALIKGAKESVSIPIIASINCMTSGDWVKYSEKIQKAGADALELNIFFLPWDPAEKTESIEKRYFDIVRNIKKNISLPVSLKLSPYFTSLAKFYRDLSETVEGLVLFNRFFNPDIDIDKKEIVSSGVISSPAEIGMPLRWIGILSPIVSCDLALSSGVHTGGDIVKALLVGAQAVYVASALYQKGPEAIQEMTGFLSQWMEKNNYAGVSEFRGLLNRTNIRDIDVFERAQFMKYYSSH